MTIDEPPRNATPAPPPAAALRGNDRRATVSRVDKPRLLHGRSELAYTTDPARALKAEPEAVSQDVQLELTRRVETRARSIRIELWLEARGRLQDESVRLRDAFGSEIADDLRALRRLLDRLDRKLRP